MMMNPVEIDVIILSYARTEELRSVTIQGLQSLVESEDPDSVHFNVIVIESEKTALPYEIGNAVTLYPDEEFGYHKYMNIGIGLTKSSYVCICNNDLLFHLNWASEILRAFDQYSDLSSASPLCPIQHPPRGFHPNSGIYFGYETRKEVSGWCIFFKRDILKITGKLDERFKFWFADDDYASTLKKHQLKHALVTSSIVDHLESRTLAERNEIERHRLTHRERFYYEYKWGKRSYFSYLNRLFKFYREEWKRK